MRGYVYVLTNAAMPWMVKIGSTKLNPYQRAGALSSSTGVPLPFTVALYGEFHDCRGVETFVHDQMATMRINVGREFFQSGESWGALREAASLICHHPRLIGEPRLSPNVLTLCGLTSVDELMNPWKAVM